MSLVEQIWKLKLSRDEYFAIVNKKNPTKRLRDTDHILPWGLDPFIVRTTMAQHMIVLTAIVASVAVDPMDAGPLSAGLYFLGGFALWPFYEYFVHKYVLHILPERVLPGWRVIQILHFLVHGYHHLRPSDTTHLMWPPIPVLCAIYALFRGWSLILGAGPAWQLCGGILLGNFIYDCAHFIVHDPPGWERVRKWRIVQFLKSKHLQHHFMHPRPQPPYGVLHPWVDALLE